MVDKNQKYHNGEEDESIDKSKDITDKFEEQDYEIPEKRVTFWEAVKDLKYIFYHYKE